MRIIAGKYKKTPLMTLEGIDITRPTRDMVKEALFSSVSINEDTVVLDLFSGSGAIGLEALSRGAKDCVFNDINKDAYKVIKANLNKLHEERRVFNLDFEACLNRLNDKFNFIYIDPPYAFDKYERVFELLVNNNLLSDDVRIIVEVKKDVILNDNYYGLDNYKEKKYGINKLLYFKKGE